ncbi:hypothetical protein ACFL9S_11870 [Erwinia sp. AnSW2-5]|uniref:hypothetical protein n=1 Tax=Erwinia sp. AnSW2-5 TaxID=3367692 RepID=UPI00385BEC37
MPKSGHWLLPAFPSPLPVIRALPALLVLLLAACSSDYKGQQCPGEIQTLSGQSQGVTQAMIIDRFSSFSVALPDLKLDSGPLQSSDRQLYIPSATTQDGWLAQRISDHRFAIINAPKDQAITFTCP